MKFSSFLLFLLLPFLSFADTEYLYLDLKKDKIELGTYKGNLSIKSDKEYFNYTSNDYHTIEEKLQLGETEKILLYFHSLYGGVNVYHKNTLKKFKNLKGIDKIVSIVWHTNGLSYVKSWKNALETGSNISELISLILEDTERENIVLCHSMGHRIFEGIISNSTSAQLNIKLLLFAGSDLDLNVFERNLRKVPSFTDKIILYIHENDRMLSISKKLHNRDRLGLDALSESAIFHSLENLERINVTKSSGGRLIKLSNHIYFKRDAQVLSDINNVLNEDWFLRENYLVPFENNISKMK